jgi:hypothetical protein
VSSEEAKIIRAALIEKLVKLRLDDSNEQLQEAIRSILLKIK